MSEQNPFDHDFEPTTEPLDLELLQKIDQLQVDPEVRKSRQAENQKRAQFQHFLNKILFWLIFLLLVLLIWIFVL